MRGSFNSIEFVRQAQSAGLSASQFANLISAGQYRTVYRKTLNYISAGDSALDWGTGNGHFARFLLERRLDVTTYSFSLDAPAGGATHISATEPVSLPFRTDTFDHVFSIGVLEHVHETGGDQGESIREISRILKPGGNFLCFHLPNKHGLVEPIKGWFMPGGHRHSKRFDRGDIEALCRAAGLDLLEVGRYNFLPRNEAERALGRISDSRIGAAAFNGMDWLLTVLMPRWSTNYYFIARKRCP